MADEGYRVAPGVIILPADIEVTGVRSSGPGGQNVNKVATTAVLKYFPASARGLTGPARDRILAVLAPKLARDGSLVVRSSRFRRWHRNRREALRKLAMILAGALHRDRQRVPTRPTRASQERRLTAKRARAEKKGRRRRKDWDLE